MILFSYNRKDCSVAANAGQTVNIAVRALISINIQPYVGKSIWTK